MTTVAYRDGVIAADTSFNQGGVVVGAEVSKIARNSKGDLAGAAGRATFSDKFLRWFLAGEAGSSPEAECNDDFTDRAFIVRRDGGGSIEVYESSGFFKVLRAPYFAIGSGKGVALGAMHAKATAYAAVVAARHHDDATNGSIETWAAEGGYALWKHEKG